MGAYLSEPITEKISTYDSGDRLSYGASSMQGWRTSQEDAHNCIMNFDKDTSFFAVYDGHGGAEVAQYCSLHLPDFLRSMSAYTEGTYSKALEECFLKFDESLKNPEVINELKQLAGTENASESDEEDTEALTEEAEMPIEELMARYKGAQLPAVPPHLRTCGDKFKSPYLRGKKSISKLNEETEENKTKQNGESDECVKDSSEAPEKLVNGETRESQEHSKVLETENAKPEPVENCVAGKSEPSEKTADAHETDVSEGCSSEKTGREQIKGKSSLLAIYNDSSEDEDEDDEEYAGSDSDNSGEEADVPNESSSEGSDDEENEVDEDEAEEEENEYVDIGFSEKEEPGYDSGCTAVVALLKGNQLYVANAGDSRCVVSRNGVAVDMSFDHKPEDEPERLRIKKAGGQVSFDGRVNGGLNLSRAIGDHAYKTSKDLSPREQMIIALPDIKTLSIDPKTDEFMVLACDGIWNYMSSQEVVDFIKKHLESGETKLSETCEKLFDHCLAPNTYGDGTGCDNMTCIIVTFNPALTAASSKKRLAEDDCEENEAKKSKVEET